MLFFTSPLFKSLATLALVSNVLSAESSNINNEIVQRSVDQHQQQQIARVVKPRAVVDLKPRTSPTVDIEAEVDIDVSVCSALQIVANVAVDAKVYISAVTTKTAVVKTSAVVKAIAKVTAQVNVVIKLLKSVKVLTTIQVDAILVVLKQYINAHKALIKVVISIYGKVPYCGSVHDALCELESALNTLTSLLVKLAPPHKKSLCQTQGNTLDAVVNAGINVLGLVKAGVNLNLDLGISL
jgi:hypothetical protein